MVKREVDILVVGGGLTGATLMLALANLGYRTLLIEAKPIVHLVQANFDARTLALAPASVRILQQLNVWKCLEIHATPIKTIHISEQKRFGSARLHANHAEPLGYVVEMQQINQAIYQRLNKKDILSPAKLTALNATTNLATIVHEGHTCQYQTKLIVAADGANSSVRQLCGLPAKTKEYEELALIANIELTRSHQQQAFERFTSSGSLALLPMTNLRSALVWSLLPDDAHQLHQNSDQEFLKTLQQTFGYRLGRFIHVGQRTLYPLKQVIMPKTRLNSVVFIGNAAHTLHPVAAQGFNLGLRDVAMLAQSITQQGLSSQMLVQYLKARQPDQTAITQLTHHLVELFAKKLPGLSIARGLGLLALENNIFLKKLVTRYASGFFGIIPDLVCGIPLRKGSHEPTI